MNLSNIRILVADDSRAIRLRLSMSLAKLGNWEVIEASNGVEAIEILTENEPPPIALMDWMMPQKNGIEVCQELSKRSQEDEMGFLRPYIIIMTAKNTPEEIAEGLDAGADDFLAKPWNDIVMGARLRVAMRTVEMQRSLKTRINEMAHLLHRYNVAHNVIIRGGRKSVPPEAQLSIDPKAVPATPSKKKWDTRGFEKNSFR